MKKLSFVFTIFLLIFLTACEMEVEDIKRTCTLQDIKVDASKAKLEYLKSQAFNSEGVKIYGYYSDNTIKEIDPRYVDFDGFPKTDDEKIIDVDIPITVFYEGFRDTYNIKFQNDCIVGIIVDIQKRNYLLHEAFQKEDIIVSAKYESGNFDVIEFPNYTISGFYTEMANITGKEVTITYKDLEPVKYDILVFPNTVTNLIIFSNPTKTIYTQNIESLDLTGLVVEAKYGVSAYVEVKPEHYTYKIFSAEDINFENPFINPDIKELDPGDYKIVIYLDNVQTEPINIKILNAYQTGMCLDPYSTPKFIYKVNEPFDINQYVFRETLSNGSIGEIIDKESTGFYLEGGDPVLSEANKKVTIKARSSFFDYESGDKAEAKCDFDIFVTDAYITEVVAEWKNNPEEKDYLPLGAKPSDEKYGTWTVTATYSDNDNTKVTIPNKYCNFEFADENIRNGKYDDFYSKLAASEDSVVEYEVNISFYKEKEDDLHSCTGKIYVGKPKIINAEITKYPTTKYTVGQTFDPQGLTIKVTTSDGNIEIYEYGEETKEFFTIDSNVFTKPKSEEVKILFKKDDFIYKPSIWVNVFENKPIALEIIPNKKIIYLRKGNCYTNDQFKDLFEIKKVYENAIFNVELTDAEYEKAIIYFEQTNIQRENSPIRYGSIYAILNDDSQNTILGKYECFERNVNGVSNDPVIFIIPSLPQNITMDNKKDNNKIAFDSNDFAESLTSENTKYNIVYKDGSTYEITGDRLKNAIVNYNSINYRLDKSQNMVKIHYETVQSDAFEPAAIRGDYVVADYTSLQNLDTIKSLRVIKNPDKNNYKFIKSKIGSDNGSYNLNNYFTAFITYFTGVEQEVTGDKLNYLHFSLNDKNIGFKVKYEDGASKAEAEINGITILEPITINDNDRDNLLKSKDLYTNVKFSFKDELGIPHNNCKIIASELTDNARTVFDTTESIKVSLNKHDDQKYYLTIPGSIEDIDGQVGNYEIELFEDFVTGLVCENGNNIIVQTYLAENGDIKNKLSSSPIKIRKFFDTNLESISAQTDGNFTFSEVNANSQTQINFTYKNESEILPFSGGAKSVNVNWTINESIQHSIRINLYPAEPTNFEKCKYDFTHNRISENGDEAIVYNYENGIKRYEDFKNLYWNVKLLDSNNTQIRPEYNWDVYYAAFDSVCTIKITVNGREYSIPISRPNQDNNNQNQQQGN